MRSRDYEYKGLLAKSWDFLRGDTSNFPDRQFYTDIIKEFGLPVLIVGCGTGRLLLEYLADGIDAEGLDVSREMLEICQQKAEERALEVTLYQQPMEAMAVPEKYRTILVPSSSFQLVPDLADARAALDAFHEHLLPGGAVVMSIWQILKEGNLEWGEWWLVAEKDGFDGEMGLRRWERSSYDASAQLRHTENRYELIHNGEVVFTEFHRRSPELRVYSPRQLTAMMTVSGFSSVQAFSGFSNERAAEDDESFCVLGVRK
jgi:SAM-dependent methyltransferase